MESKALALEMYFLRISFGLQKTSKLVVQYLKHRKYTMSSNRKGKKIKSKNLDHLGLVAGMYDELGIGDIIDDTIEQDTEKRKVSLGQAVKAMVLNRVVAK